MPMRKKIGQQSAWLATAAVTMSLVACGGSDGAPDKEHDPLQSYREQVLRWEPCDPTATGQESLGIEDDLHGRLQCSSMRVPMDWAKPDRSDVWIGVMRVAASEPMQRRGALVFNPGGPGGDGLPQALSLFWAFGESNPQSTQGALQLRLLASYDMVGFSPRGTGASTRMSCASNELERPATPSAVGVSDESLDNRDYNDRKTAEACLKNPLAPYVNTDATARDMDLLRALLGEDKLHYVGYSYGTWLGSWYASLFPDKVGRMVLDSSFDFSAALEKGFVAQPEVRQRLHEAVLLPYAARHPAYFQLGSSAADIAARVQAINPQMRYALGGVLSGLSYSASSADVYVATLAAALWLEGVLAQLVDPTDMTEVAAASRQHVFSADSPAYDQMARGQAQQLYTGYRDTFLRPRKNFDLGATAATYWTVRCNDDIATVDVQAWNALVRSTTLRAPLYTELVNPCAYWGGPRVTKLPVDAIQKLDVLMVQSQYDGATATEGANRFFAQLPNARRIYVPGDFQHGVFPYSTACVDATVIHYLLGDTPTERETVCAAKPLAQDAPAEGSSTAPPPAVQPEAPPSAPRAAQESRAATQQSPAPSPGAGTEAPTYLNPEKAQALIERFKQGIGPRR